MRALPMSGGSKGQTLGRIPALQRSSWRLFSEHLQGFGSVDDAWQAELIMASQLEDVPDEAVRRR